MKNYYYKYQTKITLNISTTIDMGVDIIAGNLSHQFKTSIDFLIMFCGWANTSDSE